MNAYIFDVDGVITEPKERIITHPEIITLIVGLLQNKNTIAFVSGRALSWLKKRVIDKITAYIQDDNLDHKLLDNIYVSGEFGGCNIVFRNGQSEETINPNLRLNSKLIERATEATKNFSDIVFIDKEKQTQFTTEMQYGLTVDQFAKSEGEIAIAYRKIVKDLKLEDIIEVHEDRIAINIKYKLANKIFATKTISRLDEK